MGTPAIEKKHHLSEYQFLLLNSDVRRVSGPEQVPSFHRCYSYAKDKTNLKYSISVLHGEHETCKILYPSNIAKFAKINSIAKI